MSIQNSAEQGFSVTGRDTTAVDTVTQEIPVVALRRCPSSDETLPERLDLAGVPGQALTIGRHEGNSVVLPIRSVSNIQCQILLRSFRLPGQTEDEKQPIHEALFLRDISKFGTFINEAPAFRPWHWLQHGDVIGIQVRNESGDHVTIDLYTVDYQQHHTLPKSSLTLEEAPTKGPTARAASQAAAKEKVRNDDEKEEPTKSPRQKPKGKAKAKGTGRTPPKARRPKKRTRLDANVVGKVVDLTYLPDPEEGISEPVTYRVKITEFLPDEGFHNVDSENYSSWDGEAFKDTVDLREMYEEGRAQFVSDNEEESPRDVTPANDSPPPKRSARLRQKRR